MSIQVGRVWRADLNNTLTRLQCKGIAVGGRVKLRGKRAKKEGSRCDDVNCQIVTHHHTQHPVGILSDIIHVRAAHLTYSTLLFSKLDHRTRSRSLYFFALVCWHLLFGFGDAMRCDAMLVLYSLKVS